MLCVLGGGARAPPSRFFIGVEATDEGDLNMKRKNIEIVLGFLDAIRRRDREAAAGFLGPEIVWQGIVPGLVCRSPDEVLDVFLGQRDQKIEVDHLELIGTEQGAVLALYRAEIWQIEGIEIRGAVYHAAMITNGRITRIEDHADRERALTSAGA
jgi:hypothetical protein